MASDTGQSVKFDMKSIAVEAFKAKVLESLTPDQVSEIMSVAVEQVLLTGKAATKLSARNFRDDLMRDAMVPVMREVLTEVIGRQDNRARIQEAVERTVGVFLAALPALLEDKITQAIVDYVPAESAYKTPEAVGEPHREAMHEAHEAAREAAAAD